MSQLSLALLVPLMLVLAACSDGPTVPTPLDEVFTLAPGQVAPLTDGSAGVRFDGVSGDSRCPADAFCILGGDATVLVAVLEGASVSPYELHTGDMRPVRHGDITLALERLEPYPFSGRPIEPSEYRLTLRATR